MLHDGSFLPLIVQRSPKLERFYLKGSFENLFHLVACLPNAENLRDLRLDWELCHGGNDASLLKFILESLLQICPSLKRLVLIFNVEGYPRDFNISAALEVFLVRFVKTKENLVALCLSGFRIDPTSVEPLCQRLTNEIVPLRQPFWFHVGPELPKVNDVPRIHYDEIVNPVDAYLAPPRF